MPSLTHQPTLCQILPTCPCVLFCKFNCPTNHCPFLLELLRHIFFLKALKALLRSLTALLHSSFHQDATFLLSCVVLLGILKFAAFRIEFRICSDTWLMHSAVLPSRVIKCADSSQHVLNFCQSALPKLHLIIVLPSCIQKFAFTPVRTGNWSLPTAELLLTYHSHPLVKQSDNSVRSKHDMYEM